MPRKSIMIAAAFTALTPAQAATSTATMRLVAVVPIYCSIDLMGANIADHRVSLAIHRHCNTGHDIVFRAAKDDATVGNITLRYNQHVIDMTDNYGRFAQPERYYDGVDEVVIQTTAGNDADLRRYVESLRVDVEVS